jgi:hypothetical protein
VDANVMARREASAQLVQVKIRLHRVDIEIFKAAAYAMALARFPVLQVGDVYPGHLPMDCDSLTGLYKFNCHSQDVEQMKAIAKGLIASHPVAYLAPSAQANVEKYGKVDPVPEWADRP